MSVPPPPDSWERRLAELLAYRKAHGDVHVPRGWPENPGLANWVVNQRRFLQKGTLPDHRRRRLEECGIRWRAAAETASLGDGKWDGMFRELVRYRKSHGHCRISRTEKGCEKLALWTATQRWLLSRGKLPTARLRRLRRLGLSAAARRDRTVRARRLGDRGERRAANWEEMYRALREYRRWYGDSHVLASEKKYSRLATWVKNQRVLKRRGRLDAARCARLDALRFEWNGDRLRRDRSDRAWERMLRALVRFKRRHGHCSVPRDWPSVRGLGLWVWRQRVCRRTGRLARGRIRQLEALRFEWSGGVGRDRVRERAWDLRLQELENHLRAHGRLPSRAGRHHSLARWTSRQRDALRAGALSPRRSKLLRAMDVLAGSARPFSRPTLNLPIQNR